MAEKFEIQKMNNVFIENRKSLTVTGVEDVDRFDDKVISIGTQLGHMTVRGTGLHIESLSLDIGEVVVCGFICAIEYQDKAAKKDEHPFRKLFR